VTILRPIYAEKLLEEFDKCLWGKEWDKALARVCVANTPTADVQENVHGKWIERKVIEDGKAIEGWQSAKCSVCGKYHTTPYLYNFDDFNYCPNCGAMMKERSNDG